MFSNRCLEEGAEEYLLKPVKLSDVKRLKDLIFKSGLEEIDEIRTQKRKHKLDQSLIDNYEITTSLQHSPQQSLSKRARL